MSISELVPNLLYEYFFADYVVRIIESEPGIVHFEQARIERGDPSLMHFELVDKPMGVANEILQLDAKTKKLSNLRDEACADAVILCHAYRTDNAPPKNILRRYEKK